MWAYTFAGFTRSSSSTAAAPSTTTAIGNPVKNRATAATVTTRLFTNKAVCRFPSGTRSSLPSMFGCGFPVASFGFSAALYAISVTT